jgi:SAM-dependent methyltransferase
MLEPSELFPEVPNLYEFPSIHGDMIYDENRVGAYERAIARTVKPGDVVLDVGTGTGILAFLALKAGARKVHAVDRSPVIKWAEQLADANGFSDRIEFHFCDSRDARIDEKVDVIVSELIGHIAFEEGMIESISHAKEHFLKPGGALIPQWVTLFAAPVYESDIYRFCIDSWTPKYGIDYSIMREKALKTSYVTDIEEEQMLAKHQSIFSMDFRKDMTLEVDATRTFEVHRDGEVNGLAFWFNSALADFVELSSGPWSKTHWKQCFTPFAEPRNVKAGEKLNIRFSMVLCDRRSEKFKLNAEITE